MCLKSQVSRCLAYTKTCYGKYLLPELSVFNNVKLLFQFVACIGNMSPRESRLTKKPSLVSGVWSGFMSMQVGNDL